MSEGFTQKLPPAVLYVVLLSKDLMFLTARLWEGSGWTVGVGKVCVCFPTFPLPRRGIYHPSQGFKRIEKDG